MNKKTIDRLIGGLVLFTVGAVILPIVFDGAGLSSRRPDSLTAPDQPIVAKVNIPIPPLEPVARELSEPTALNESNAEQTKAHQASVKHSNNDKSSSQSDITPITPAVETKATKSKVNQVVTWVVQVGSFNSQVNANQMVGKLKKKKLPAFSRNASSGGDIVHRVLVGPYTKQKKADGIKERIFKDLGLRSFVTNYRPS